MFGLWKPHQLQGLKFFASGQTLSSIYVNYTFSQSTGIDTTSCLSSKIHKYMYIYMIIYVLLLIIIYLISYIIMIHPVELAKLLLKILWPFWGEEVEVFEGRNFWVINIWVKCSMFTTWLVMLLDPYQISLNYISSFPLRPGSWNREMMILHANFLTKLGNETPTKTNNKHTFTTGLSVSSCPGISTKRKEPSQIPSLKWPGCTFVDRWIAKKHIQNHGHLKNSTCPIHGTCLFAYVSRLVAN